MKFLSLLIGAALSLVAIGPVQANETFTYTGNPWGTGTDSSLGTELTMSVTFIDIVNSTFTGKIYSTEEDEVKWSVSSGLISFNSDNFSNKAMGYFEFSDGKITKWDIDLNYDDLQTVTSVSGLGYDYDKVDILADAGNIEARNNQDAGSWSLVSDTSPTNSVPEPTPLVLLGAGLAILTALANQRRRLVP